MFAFHVKFCEKEGKKRFFGFTFIERGEKIRYNNYK